MIPLKFAETKLGNLGVIECRYELTENIEPMDSFDRVYLHNTFKHTNIEGLLDYHVTQRRFAGIGYHFAIDERGNVYLTRPLDVMGAHTFGRNRESIGVVLLDCNKCAESDIAIEHFMELHRELRRLAGRDVPVLSHSYGQFEYLNDTIRAYNTGLPDELQFPHVDFDESIADNDKFIAKKWELIEILEAYRREHNPDSIDGNQHEELTERKKEEFGRLITAIDVLKICPGRSYFAFVKRIK